MSKIYIGVDNGVSGSIGIITDTVSTFQPMPVKECLSYTKKVRHLNRIDCMELSKILNGMPHPIIVVIERPMVNPKRFHASVSAIRALEATLIVVENYGIPYQYIDSKQWQKVLIPAGIKGTEDLKRASAEIGKRMFPQLSTEIDKQKDADGLLIAEFARRAQL